MKNENQKLNNVKTVNVKNDEKDDSNNVNNVVDETPEALIEKALKRFSDRNAKTEWVAQEIAKKLDDEKSLNFYKKLAKECPAEMLFGIVAITKDAWDRGVIETTKGKYFTGVLKRKKKQSTAKNKPRVSKHKGV